MLKLTVKSFEGENNICRSEVVISESARFGGYCLTSGPEVEPKVGAEEELEGDFKESLKARKRKKL